MFDTKQFGAHMARLRKNADMTQSEIADRLSLTRQAVSKYETGESFPDVSILIKIAEVFGVTLDSLIGSGRSGPADVGEVVRLAPHVKPSTLMALTESLGGRINISHIISLVQYLNDENLLRLLKSAELGSLDGEMLEKLIPFLDEDSREVLAEKIIGGEIDWRLLEAVYPYIEYLHNQLEAAVIDGALPKEVLGIINKKYR